jgi:hypothetical protein
VRKGFTTGNYFSGHYFENHNYFHWQYFLLFTDFTSEEYPAAYPDAFTQLKTEIIILS